MTDRPEVTLILRVKAPPFLAPTTGPASLEVEALLDFFTIFPCAPTKLDFNELNGCLGKSGNAYGKLLGESICAAASVRDALRELADSDVVRVQLMLEGSELLNTLRWERMEIPDWRGGPLGVNLKTPFSRFAAMNRKQEEPIEDHVFRLVLAVASPEAAGIAPIDVEEECASVVEPCAGLLERNQLHITILPGKKGLSEGARKRLSRSGVRIEPGSCTAESVARELSKVPLAHALHIIAHGTYQAQQHRFFLLLESETGGLGAKSGEEIIELWKPERLRLMVLESCQSAVNGTAAKDLEAFKGQVAGFMQMLVQAGVPGVVAMQDKIAVKDARSFNQGFYNRLLEDGFADQAVNNGRQLLRDSPADAWSIPAFATRMKRGALWSESPVRKAGRALFAKVREAKGDQFPDFPLDVIPVLTNDLKASSKMPSTSTIDQVRVPTTVQADVYKSLSNCLENCANRVICLLGDSGRAKNNILEATFLAEAKRHWEDRQPAIPVMLRLQDCMFSKLNARTTFAAAISNYFSDRTGFAPNPAYIASRFRERSFLFLINADDDFQQGSVQEGLQMLKAFRGSFAGQPGGDPHGYVLTLDKNLVMIEDLPEDSECLILQPMSVERVGHYLKTLPSKQPNSAAPEEDFGGELLTSLQKNGLFDLAEVPWLFSEMLDQHRRGVGQTSRAAILKRITDDRIGRIKGSAGMRKRVEETIFRLGWELQNRRQRSLPGSELFRILSELRGNRDFSLFEFRSHLIDDCRILAPVGEDGVRFTFSGFRAYCCAQYLCSQPDEVRTHALEEITAVLGRRARSDRWTETLIVLAGLRTDTGNALRIDTGTLLRMILSGSPLHEGEQVFVAARCLQEAKLAAKQTISSEDPTVRSITSSLIHRSHPLSFNSATARQRVLQYLGPLKEECTIPHLLSLVLQKVRLGSEGKQEFDYSGVRLAAIKALFYMPKEATMLAVSKNPDWNHNEGLKDVLQQGLDLDASRLLTDVDSDDTLTSSVAAFFLSLTKPAGALDKLADRFRRKTENLDLQWALADSILELGDTNVAGMTEECMKDENRWSFAAYLMGKSGAINDKPDFRRFLNDHLEDEAAGKEGLRGRCLRALAELSQPGVRDTCHDWLKQGHPLLRYYALEGLRHAGDGESLAILERLQWSPENTPSFEHLRLEIYEDLYWSLAGGLSREVMIPM